MKHIVAIWFLFFPVALHGHEGAKVVAFYGYDNCLELKNETTRVVLCPAVGGRVLVYSLGGKNALYLSGKEQGWKYAPSKKGGDTSAGRFDIGPEQTIAKHPLLWKGPWKGEIIGDRSARLISEKDDATGVQLIREFSLAASSSELKCKQTIMNVGDIVREYCHWSRTFALGGGIVVIPLTKPSRFPHGYVQYESSSTMNFKPQDDNIRQRYGFLEIVAAPKFPKLGMDTTAGWFAYAMPNDVLFVKRFAAHRDRIYNEVAGLTMSIWYPDGPMCELEPIGPRERIKPGESASFTETWELTAFPFPSKEEAIDMKKIERLVGPTKSD